MQGWKKYKRWMVDLAMAGIPLLAIGVPPWMHGGGFERTVDETTLIAPSARAVALSSPLSSDVLIDRLCAKPCIECHADGIQDAELLRDSDSCLLPDPALRIPAGGKLECRSQCTRIQAVVVTGALDS